MQEREGERKWIKKRTYTVQCIQHAFVVFSFFFVHFTHPRVGTVRLNNEHKRKDIFVKNKNKLFSQVYAMHVNCMCYFACVRLFGFYFLSLLVSVFLGISIQFFKIG